MLIIYPQQTPNNKEFDISIEKEHLKNNDISLY